MWSPANHFLQYPFNALLGESEKIDSWLPSSGGHNANRLLREGTALANELTDLQSELRWRRWLLNTGYCGPVTRARVTTTEEKWESRSLGEEKWERVGREWEKWEKTEL